MQLFESSKTHCAYSVASLLLKRAVIHIILLTAYIPNTNRSPTPNQGCEAGTQISGSSSGSNI